MKIELCDKHTWKWLGSMGQCTLCFILAPREIKEADCIGFITPEQEAKIEAARKEKRKAEREIKKKATIEWLKKK